jgi:tRNA 2-selenouridine synthase
LTASWKSAVTVADPVDGWLALLQAGALKALARALMDEHYDPTYRSGRTRHGADVLQRFDVAFGDRRAGGLAGRIAAWIETVS